MSSFYFRAVGYLARNPELVAANEGTYYRLCLTSQDYGEDELGHFSAIVQSLWFVATNTVGAAIAGGAHRGDQLFVEGKIRKHHWTAKWGEAVTLVVTGFQYGARRNPPSPTAAVIYPPSSNPCLPAEGVALPTDQ